VYASRRFPALRTHNGKMWDFLTGIPTQNFMRGALKKVFWGNVTPGAFLRALALIFRRLIQLSIHDPRMKLMK
jgi:hypothetical protein